MLVIVSKFNKNLNNLISNNQAWSFANDLFLMSRCYYCIWLSIMMRLMLLSSIIAPFIVGRMLK